MKSIREGIRYYAGLFNLKPVAFMVATALMFVHFRMAYVATNLIMDAICPVANADSEPIAATLRADGSTNTWTQADLTDALGLMNRKYWRDMENETGRQQWHGDLMMQYVFTNESGRLMRVCLYADGFCHTGMAQRARFAPDPEAKAKREAEIRAWEAAHLPPDLAALRDVQRRAAEAASSNVTVYVEGN